MRGPAQVDAWDHPKSDGTPWPDVDTDPHRDVIATILGPRGEPLHTVKRASAVEFGFRQPTAPTRSTP